MRKCHKAPTIAKPGYGIVLGTPSISAVSRELVAEYSHIGIGRQCRDIPDAALSIGRCER